MSEFSEGSWNGMVAHANADIENNDFPEFQSSESKAIVWASQRITELEQELATTKGQLREQVAYCERLLPLARRCLWIAYNWNDHNFDFTPEQYARQEADVRGISDFNAANKFLAERPSPLLVAEMQAEAVRDFADKVPQLADTACQESLIQSATAILARYYADNLIEQAKGE